MHVRARLVPLFVLLTPLEVHVPPGESVESGAAEPDPRLTFDVVGGGGSYALVPRDCSGRVVGPPIGNPYRDAAASADLRSEHWRVGVRGGWVRVSEKSRASAFGDPDAERRIWYWNPHVGLDLKYLGLGYGPLLWSEELPATELDMKDVHFSGRLRLGTRRRHLRLSVMEGQPLVSGGGYLQLGVGTGFRERDSLFLGLSLEPYDSGGLATSLDLAIHERLSLLTRGRFGSAAGRFEGGLAIGLRWYAR